MTMTVTVEKRDDRMWTWFRRAMWGGAIFLLVLPAVAMRFTSEVNWTGSDFVFAAVLLFGSAGIIELAGRASASFAYRTGVVVAVGAAFLTIWVNGAVGMIGSEDNPYNLWFGAVVAIGLIGAIAANFRAGGMALAMTVAAIAQAVVGGIGIASDPRGGALSTGFALLWLLSAGLFRNAARAQMSVREAREE